MNTLKIENSLYKVPSSWKELSYEKMVKVAPFLFAPEERRPLNKVLVLFALVPQLKKYWITNRLLIYILAQWPYFQPLYPSLSFGQKWDMLSLVNWLFEDISGKSIVREFRHKGVRYIMPEDNLTKESIIAYFFADTYFDQFIQTGDFSFLDKVIACLARQEGSVKYPALQEGEGDPREHFSTSRTNQRSIAFKDLNIGIKNAIILYFMGSKKYIHQQYEILFRVPKEDTVDKDGNSELKKRASFGKKKIPKPDYGWLGVIYDLAEQKTFGNFDQVKHQFLHTCCYYLTKKKYEQEEQTA